MFIYFYAILSICGQMDNMVSVVCYQMDNKISVIMNIQCSYTREALVEDAFKFEHIKPEGLYMSGSEPDMQWFRII